MNITDSARVYSGPVTAEDPDELQEYIRLFAIRVWKALFPEVFEFTGECDG